MSPKVADPQVRAALIETAARITAEEGREALTLRRLAREVGVSTMAVYTHFGSMAELRRALLREGFARFRAHLAAVETTGDAVADLIALGFAYYRNATENPNLYRVMFMEQAIDVEDAHDGWDTFERAVDAIRRCVEAGRFDPADPVELAMQVWVCAHGIVSLELAGMLDTEQALHTFRDMARNLFESFGDNPSALGGSFARALSR